MLIMKNFIDLFSGLQRAHGCTYVEKKNADGTKIKGKSFVKRETCNRKTLARSFKWN